MAPPQHISTRLNLRQVYNKLIRDRIPEIIKASGKKYAVETMTEAEYKQALLEKLVEEAQEACTANREALITELADLQEVIDAILTNWEIPCELVQQVKFQRHEKRGGFDKRLKLLWTDEG